MTCFMCKGSMKDGFSTFTTDMGGSVVVIRNVPSYVCEQCGETTYNSEVAKHLEQIVKNISKAAITEVSVVSYSNKAA